MAISPVGPVSARSPANANPLVTQAMTGWTQLPGYQFSYPDWAISPQTQVVATS